MGRGGDRRRADHRPVAGGSLRGTPRSGPRPASTPPIQQPRLQLVARGPRGGPGQRGRDAPHARLSPAQDRFGRRRCLARHNVRYKPRPDLFAQFARAAALRYAGAVDRWIIWNEPNLPLWLQPQNTCKGSRCTPYAPHLYRRLVRAAYPAIKTGRPDVDGPLRRAGAQRREPDQAGTPGRARWPSSARWAASRSRSGAIAAGRARASSRSPATAWAYHPHATKLAPDEQQSTLDNASIGDVPRLERTLDATQRAGGLKKPGGGRFPLYFTEWGYQTRPPDRTRGVTLAQQSRYLQQGAYLAYRDPRVRLLTQYEWRDEPVRRSTGGDAYAGWQSGLLFANDKPKPALKSFANPYFIDQRPGSRSARLWGQVRPGVTHQVTVQRRRAGSRRWTTVKVLSTNGSGLWTLRRRSRGPLTTASAGSRPTSTTRRPAR